ncbi:kinase-like domain-containing protein [Colletotrichum phormii]|uniref:Kinase-like domain-containing protein n=1 Tax=Colletotrichum phormii TaxID=359342 RepID=A0AAJ0EBA8_9PEZI|nr:kinase-like domain-containing protein [Colletotrichum phormii]KAK1624870.1 kinase-like domain-containing protein [Colletotrichum phormii]
MSTIQQLKNFIRHGKQARANNDEPAAKQSPPPKAHLGVSEPAFAAAPPAQATPEAYSVAGDGQNRAAQANHAAAHAAEPNQYKTSKAGKNIDNTHLAKLVAEENESKSKFPRYPGLERWELVEKMGDGAFSNVYRARDTSGEHPGECAIKVVRKYEMNSMQGNKHLHPDFKKVPKAAERANILKEVQIMRQLDHPNIIKLVDFSESRQYYYIILELAPGGELFHQIVRLTYFSEELSRHVIVQVAQALEYLHEERGVVHRDIKPENILFSPIPVIPSKNPKPKQPGDEDKVDEGDFIPGVGAGGIGQIKIADFGLSKIVWDNQTMTPCGTVGYTAPEIVKDERYSKSVDMWALGCVLYTLLCGFPPFYDESIEVLTEKVAKGQYTFLSPWWDDISKSAQDLISHLLTVDPEKRYTITEFLAHPWIKGSGPTLREEKKTQPDMLRAFDANRINDGDRRYDFRSPGAVNLREVFDVGYAVHRQEEEAKRRKQIGTKGGVPARFLNNLNEESEDEDAEMAENKEAEYVHKPSQATQALEQSMRNAQIKDQQEHRGRERERQAPAANEKGYGQHSATVTAAARQQVRDRNRQKGAFELSLDGATLLGRRNKQPLAARAGGA